MKVFITCIVLLLNCQLSGQEELSIKNSLHKIQETLDDLPEAKDSYANERYTIKYDTTSRKLTLSTKRYEKETHKKKKDSNIFTFRLSSLDPDGVVIKVFDSRNEFELVLHTHNNQTAIKQQVQVEGVVRATSYPNRLTFGRWDTQHLKAGERLKQLFYDLILKGQDESIVQGNGEPAEIVLPDDAQVISIYQDDNIPEEQIVYTVVENMPKFPGGMKKLEKYLDQNLRHPDEGKKDKTTGIVYVNFIIEKDGSVSTVRVLRGIGNAYDEEALRLIRQMPQWKPGMQSGKVVRVNYNLPVHF